MQSSANCSVEIRDDLEGWVYIRRRFVSIPEKKYLRLNGSTITVHDSPEDHYEFSLNTLRATISVCLFGLMLTFEEKHGPKYYFHFKNRTDGKQWATFIQNSSVKDFWTDYGLIEMIGKGSYSTVYKARRRKDCTLVAIKKVAKNQLDISGYHKLKREMFLLKNIKHNSIVGAYDVYNYPSEAFFVLKYAKGGLLGRNVNRVGRRVDEHTAIHITKQVLSAVSYLHENGCVHRDIKMENVLCEHSDLDTAAVFLADFGFVNFVDDVETDCMDSFLGTALYMAPEIQAKTLYSAAVDLYSVGVMIFRMLCGDYPYVEEQQFGKGALGRPLKFTNQIWPTLSEHARDMIRELLQPIPSSRLTAETALSHPWLSMDSWTIKWNIRKKNLVKTMPTNLSAINSLIPFRHLLSPELNQVPQIIEHRRQYERCEFLKNISKSSRKLAFLGSLAMNDGQSNCDEDSQEMNDFWKERPR